VAGRSRPPPNSTVRFRQLAEARADNDWLASGSSSVQQQALRDFDQAMAVYFAGTHRNPSWRKAGRNEGFCVRDVTVRRLNRRWSAVQVPKVGELRFRLSRPLPAKTGMARRVTLDRAGRWHVAFTAAQPPVDREPTGSAMGSTGRRHDRGAVRRPASAGAAQREGGAQDLHFERPHVQAAPRVAAAAAH